MRPALILLLLLMSGSAAAGPPPSSQAVGIAFYQAWAKGDVRALVALWKPNASELPAFRRRITQIFRVRCFTLKRLAVTGNGSTVEADVVLGKVSRAHPDGELIETHHAILDVEETRSGWRVTRWRLREEMAADALAASRDAAVDPELMSATFDRALCTRAVQQVNHDDYESAARLAALAHRLAAESGDTAGLALARSVDSILLRRNNADLAEAQRAGAESVALAERAHDPDVLVRALVRAARTWKSSDPGDRRRIELLDRALALEDDVEDLATAAITSSQAAAFYDDQGDHVSARRYAEKTLRLAESSGDDFAVISAELNLGGNFGVQADSELAVPHFERVLALSKRAHYQEGVVEALEHLAGCYLDVGRTDDFLRVTASALALTNPVRHADQATRLLLQRALYHFRIGDYESAARDARRAIVIARNSDERGVRGESLLMLAWVRLAQNRNADALRLIEESIKEVPAWQGSWIRAVALWRVGRRREGYQILDGELRAIEVGRRRAVGDERQRGALFALYVAPYRSLVTMLVADGRFTKALTIAEESKGRVLLDLLRGGPKIAEERVSADDRERERALERRVAALQRSADASGANEGDLHEAYVALDAFRSTLYAKYPRLRMQRNDAPAASLREIESALPDRRSAFVEYIVDGPDVVAFVVRGRSVHARRLPIAAPLLAARARRLESLLSQRGLGYEQEGRQLYDALIAPFEHDLEGVDTLCIVPDEALWQVPFEALVDPRGRFVAERFATLYAPSITTFIEMTRAERATTHRGRLLAIADPASTLPPLTDARREVAGIGALFRSPRLFSGAQASSALVEKYASEADVLHFATHGVLDDDNPMYSRVLLSDGALTAWQMMRLHLRARLAVLSACSTQRGRYRDGEGLIGMSWALLVGGCTSVLVSHWDVASAPTADLMIHFYRQWRTAAPEPFGKARALQRARLQVMHEPRTRHPMYWAAFVLIGADG